MSRLTLLLIINLIIFSSGKIIQDPRDNDLEPVSESSQLDSFVADGKLWILDIKEDVLDNLRLRRPTAEDEEEFITNCAPLIKKYNSKSKMAKKDGQATNETLGTSEAESNITREDIFKYLNKFALFTAATEPDGEEEISIAINFKGQYTSIIVKLGFDEWNYFYSKPPFPSWFYEEHTVTDQDDYVQVPADVVEKFYPSLYLLLQKAMNYLV